MKIDKEYIIEFLRKQRKFLNENFEVISISLFGSFARGEEREDSDIDLLVEMPPDLHNLVSLINYLESSFGKKVDVIRSRTNLHPRFRKRLMKEKINA
jgi:predicted nucleotidyltransferase